MEWNTFLPWRSVHIYLYGRIARILKQRVYIITCNGRIQEENANLPCKKFSTRPTIGIPADSTGQQKLLTVTKTEEYLSHTRAIRTCRAKRFYWATKVINRFSQRQKLLAVTKTEEYLSHTRAAWSGDVETEHSQVTNTEEYLTHISEQLELGLGDVATDWILKHWRVLNSHLE